MCGILGLVDFGQRLDCSERIEKQRVLRHRGPDAHGYVGLRDGVTVDLAHQRLSILDLSDAGRQPMCNADRSLWIVFNGEIYNFRELASELSGKGYKFRSRTDTEVILALYQEEGLKAISKLNGMFAFAIWDVRNRRLLLARDRLGVKPLVYRADRTACVFASEIKALLPLGVASSEIDQEAVELFFTFNHIPAPWTIYKDIRKLFPGHMLIFDEHGMRIRKYWDIESQGELGGRSESEIAERLRSLVQDATRIRMYSDVPVGAFLSGGIDSSIVVANMARSTSSTVKTFSIGYEEDKAFDETAYARDVATMYGTDHHELILSKKLVPSVVPEVLDFLDEPFADSSVLPTYIVCRETRKHVTVALSGDGGDELFGGYKRYLGEVYNDFFVRIPPVIRRAFLLTIRSWIPESKGNKASDFIRRVKIFLEGVGDTTSERHYKWLCSFSDGDREKVFTQSMRSEFTRVGRKHIEALLPPWEDRINAVLYTDMKSLLPFDMLTKVDWMSMMNSLEVRSPLLDYRVAEAAFAIPGSFKVKPFKLKSILKIAFRDMLPESLWNRPKQGFEIPIGPWFKHDPVIQKLFWDRVDSPRMRSLGIFDIDGIKHIYDQHIRNERDHTARLWALLVFAWWVQGPYGLSR